MRALLGILVCALLFGCGSSGKLRNPLEPKDRAPRVSPMTVKQLEQLPDPAVRHEPRSKGGNKSVYTVLGKSYRVMDSADGFRQKGVASWYGTKFHGRKTANGETFDIYKLTAAHPHLPIPTYVRVTNLDNGRKTIVRVNDRGPFHSGRIIDLSYAAAVKLGFHNHGTARVLVETVTPNRATPRGDYMLQAAAYSDLRTADARVRELVDLTGVRGVVVRADNRDLYRVQLGPVAAGSKLNKVRDLLQKAGYGAPHLIPLK